MHPNCWLDAYVSSLYYLVGLSKVCSGNDRNFRWNRWWGLYFNFVQTLKTKIHLSLGFNEVEQLFGRVSRQCDFTSHKPRNDYSSSTFVGCFSHEFWGYFVQTGEFPQLYKVTKVFNFIAEEETFFQTQRNFGVQQYAMDGKEKPEVIREWLREYNIIVKIEESELLLECL